MGLLIDEFGIVACGLAVLGLVLGFQRERKKLIVAASFPLLMVLYMSTNRVHFTRTVLPVFPAIAVLMAAGASFALERFVSLLRRREGVSTAQSDALRLGAVAVLVAAVVASAPLHKLWVEHNPTPDSRILAARWIEENVPRGSTIVYSSKLDWDARSLESHYELVAYGFRECDAERYQRLYALAADVVQPNG